MTNQDKNESLCASYAAVSKLLGEGVTPDNKQA